MNVGTIESIEDQPDRPKIKRSVSGKGGSGSGQNDDGGDHMPKNFPNGDDFDEVEYPSNKFRIAMWFLLLVVMMTFGGLVAAYVVTSANEVLEWKPFLFPKQVWFSTLLLFASSLTYVIANRALEAENQRRSKTWFVLTTILGAIFIASQLFLWLGLYREGIYMASNPYAGFFYILTAVHAVHVLGGMIALSYIVLLTTRVTNIVGELEDRKTYANAIGWYWHFMGAIWVVIIAALAFWK